MPNYAPIYDALNLLTRMTSGSLEYWLTRIHWEADKEGVPFETYTPRFLESQLSYILHLIEQAHPLPDTHRQAAELALCVDRLIQRTGDFRAWQSAIQGLVVAMDVPGFDDRLLLAALWRCVAQNYQHLGDMPRSRRTYQYAMDMADGQSEPDRDMLAELRQCEGGLRAVAGDFEAAEAAARALMADAQAHNDLYTLMLGHTQFAHLRLLEYRAVEAFAHAQQAFVLSVVLGNDTLRVQVLMYMADACRVNKQLCAASRYLDRASVEVHRLNNAPWLAYLDHTRGALAVETGEFSKAIACFQEAQEYFRKVQDRASEINSTQALGIALYRAEDDGAAEPVLLDAARGLKELGKRNELANVLYTLGLVYERTLRLGAARAFYQEALTLAEAIDEPYYQDLGKNIRKILDRLDEQRSAAD